MFHLQTAVQCVFPNLLHYKKCKKKKKPNLERETEKRNLEYKISLFRVIKFLVGYFMCNDMDLENPFGFGQRNTNIYSNSPLSSFITVLNLFCYLVDLQV